MKKFIYTLLVFICLSVVLAYVLDLAITKGLHRYTDYTTEVWMDLRDASYNPDVIVLGTCVAFHDINPRIVDSVLNVESYIFSMSNLTFPCHNFMWEMYKDYKPQLPKTIILALDYGDMSYRAVKTSMEDEQFLSLVDNAIARDFLTRYGGYKWYEIYLPLCRYYGRHQLIKNGIRGAFNGGGKRYKEKGYLRLNESYTFHAEYYDKENTIPVEDELISMLEAFLADCANLNIQVVITIPPIGHELEEIITNVDEIYTLYDSIAKKYHCPFLKYTQNDFSHDIDNFESPNHLNEKGSYAYTLILAEWIKSLNLE